MVDLNSPVDIPRPDLVVVADSSSVHAGDSTADTGMGFTDIRHQLGVYEHNFGDISAAYKRWDRLTHDNPHKNPLTFLAKMWAENDDLNGGVVNSTPPPSRGDTASSWLSPSIQSRGPTLSAERWGDGQRERLPQPQQTSSWRSPSRQSRGPTERWGYGQPQPQPQPQPQRKWGGQRDYPRLGLSLALLAVCSIAVGLGC